MEGFSNGGVPSFSPARDGSFACNIFFLRKWNKNPYVFLKSWSSRSFFICRRILSMSYTMKRIRSIWSSGKSLTALTWASSGWLHDRQLSSRVGRAWLSDVGTTAGRHAWHWQLASFWRKKVTQYCYQYMGRVDWSLVIPFGAHSLLPHMLSEWLSFLISWFLGKASVAPSFGQFSGELNFPCARQKSLSRGAEVELELGP